MLRDRDLAQDRAKRLRAEVLLAAIGGIQPQNERPWQGVFARGPDLSHVGVTGRQRLVALRCTRVVGLSRGNRGKDVGQLLDERVAQRPALRQNEELGRVAVEGRVVRDHPRRVLGHARELGVGVRAWHHEHGAHVTELARDGLLEERVVAALAIFPLGSRRAPHDEVVGLVRAGDVHVADARVIGEIRADLRAAVDDCEVPSLDEGPQGPLEQRAEVLVDGVHLEENDAPVDEHLVDDVHRRNRRDVSRAEDQRYEAVGIALLVEGGLVLRDRRASDARLQPCLRGDPAVERGVEGIVRRDSHADGPVRKVAQELLAQDRSPVVVLSRAACESKGGCCGA